MKLTTVCVLLALVALPAALAVEFSLKEGLTKSVLPFTDANILQLARQFIADIQVGDKKFAHFKESVRKVREHNAKTDNTYTLDVDSPFAFMSDEEFFSNYLGASAKGCASQVSSSANLHIESISKKVKVPASINWTDLDKVSPVKDQQSCSSSWAFASTAAIESHYAILEDVEAPSLSEQQLVDCSSSNSGCDSGLPSKAFEYVKSAGGIAFENSYFYESMQQECAFEKDTIGARVSSFVNVDSGNEKLMKQAVGTVGPVTAVFSVLDDFKLYKSGIYKSTKCSSSKTAVNHAVLVVGYGSKLGTDYWLAKNSWSEYWGDEGYFKIKRGNNMCGIANCVSYPVMSTSDSSASPSFAKNFMAAAEEY